MDDDRKWNEGGSIDFCRSEEEIKVETRVASEVLKRLAAGTLRHLQHYQVMRMCKKSMKSAAHSSPRSFIPTIIEKAEIGGAEFESVFMRTANGSYFSYAPINEDGSNPHPADHKYVCLPNDLAKLLDGIFQRATEKWAAAHN